MPGTFYVTAAITYPNAKPHLGHVYEWIGCDVLARHRSLRGDEVRFTTGSDEHSQSVERAARAEGLETRAFCDRQAEHIRSVIAACDAQPTCFVRTDSEANHRTANALWTAVHEAGHLFKAPYKGWFCPSCEQFYTEKDLDEGLCPVHHAAVELVEEENWFFRLSAFADRLLEHYDRHPGFVAPEARRNEMLSVIRQGLQDISVSRGFSDWGIPVPGDPSQVIWVWFDALPSYMTAVGYQGDDAEFSRFWPADVHVVGKDISRFHCITWPAMLMAAGLPLPTRVHSHGFITLGGEKMSKTRGIFIDPVQLIAEQGSDAVRYVLMTEVPFDRDGDFSMELFIDRYNADLANDYGNLVSRTEKMLDRWFGGRVPERGGTSPLDAELRGLAAEVVPAYDRCMDKLDFSGALDEVRRLVGRANKYIEESAPWNLHKQGDDRLATVMVELLEAIRVSTILLHPVIPRATTAVAGDLGISLDGDQTDALREWNQLESGQSIRVGGILFPRLDREQLLERA